MAVKYSEDHEWISVEGDVATVGITDFAQNALGDIVFVELPDVDRDVEQGEECSVVESVKAASEVYAPITGTITEVNADLEDAPGLVNTSPEGDGWFFKMTIGDAKELDDLMDASEYKSYCDDQE